MNITKSNFQGLIVASVLVSLSYLPVYLLSIFILPTELQRFIGTQFEVGTKMGGAVGIVVGLALLGFGLVVFCLSMIAAGGLFFFWRPARPLILALWGTGFFFTCLLGPVVESGLAAAWRDLGMGLSGAVIAMAYCSPIKELFEAKAAAPAAAAAKPPGAMPPSLPSGTAD